MEKPQKKNQKNLVKVMHMAIGVDLIGSKTSLATNKNTTLEATAIGIKAYSKGTKRIIVIPYSNVKGFELYPESDESEDESKKAA